MIANKFFGYWGHLTLDFLKHVSSIYHMFRLTLKWTFIKPFQGKPIRWRYVFSQMDEVGVKSIPIVLVVALSIGIIIALQTAYKLKQLGGLMYVGSLVSVSMMRELGPITTAIVLAGRVGAAFTAEMGTMNVSQEIMALETMAIHPIGFLVVPRFIAILIMLPCLTIIADLVGIFGGYLVGTGILNIGGHLFISKCIEAIVVKDIISGLLKSIVFAAIIVMVSSYMAFIVEGGAEGVGKTTMLSVVASLISIFIADSIFTTIFYFIL
jgi:phospholipid/cholesterol/gamma-HCH transport system permease protein